jgi:hypothetical protein
MIVLGSGAARMTAAFVAARVGGTSARSSGTLWIPKDKDAASRYLDALVGDKGDRRLHAIQHSTARAASVAPAHA